jgi:hypothetical protein
VAAHLEIAPTGRSKCRGCGRAIGMGERRIGDAFASPFADGVETTHWYHARCAAYKRPEVLLEAFAGTGPPADAAADAALAASARLGTAHRRLPRIDGAERAPTGRATCRLCKQKIDAKSWRIRLVIFDVGRFEPSGTVHAGCAAGYFGCSDLAELMARARHFAPSLGDGDAGELAAALAAGAPPAPPASRA